MHLLDNLDEPKATLRLLVELSIHLEGMNVTWLYQVMKENYGVGRPAVDTSYKALIRSGLAEEYDAKGSKSKLKVIQLTLLGQKIATKINEIEGILVAAKQPDF
jgi:hypothetical protein